MDEKLRILAVAGSWRADSLNRKLLSNGVEALKSLGAEVDVLDLKPLGLPIYDQEIEDGQGLPPGVQELKRRIKQADGLLLAVPEYNASVPGGFKNALDWASRGSDDVFSGKVAALMSASPGGFGGIRMNPHLRQILRSLGVVAIHEQVTLSRAHEAFDPDGKLVSPQVVKQVHALAEALTTELRLRRLAARQLRHSFIPGSESATTPTRR